MTRHRRLDVHGCPACGEDHAGQERVESEDLMGRDGVRDLRVTFRPLATPFPHAEGGEPYRWTARCPANGQQILMRLDDEGRSVRDMIRYEPWPGGRHGGVDPKRDVTDARGRPL